MCSYEAFAILGMIFQSNPNGVEVKRRQVGDDKKVTRLKEVKPPVKSLSVPDGLLVLASKELTLVAIALRRLASV